MGGVNPQVSAMATKRKIKIGDIHGFIGETKSKSKPKPYVQSELITNYFRERDRILYKLYPYLREQLTEKYEK